MFRYRYAARQRQPRMQWLNRDRILLSSLALLLVLAGDSIAQDVTFKDEYMKRLKMYETMQPLEDKPFGESINMYTGELGFNQTDITLPGKGPSIVVSRVYKSMAQNWANIGTLGDWDLSIPRIETFVKTPSRFAGGLGTPATNWLVPTYPNGPSGAIVPSNARCTKFNMPYDAYQEQSLWWQGMELIDEHGTRQQMMGRTAAYTAKPAMTGSNGQPVVFPAVTLDKWQIGCLPSITEGATGVTGQGGEGFLAVSPDGTRYYFDYLVGIRGTNVLETVPYESFVAKQVEAAKKSESAKAPAIDAVPAIGGGGTMIFHPRMLAVMYVSRIEDRFGNYLTYQYSGDKLTSITASDGRKVGITWLPDTSGHMIASIKTQPNTPAITRTWSYAYSGGLLSRVTLPDATAWSFDMHVGGGVSQSTATCTTRTPGTQQGTEGTSTLVHPSGLTGAFVVAGTYHARSYVPSFCAEDPESHQYYEEIYPVFSSQSLKRKTFSGPGVTTATWKYTYSPAQGSTTSDACAQTKTCLDTRWVDVTSPTGDRSRYTFSTHWGAMEGKPVKTEMFQGTSTLLRTDTIAYAPFNSGPFPSRLGGTMQDWHSNSEKSEVWMPERQRVTTQDGATFTWQVATAGSGYAFDAFANPTRVTKFSSLGYSKVETTEYQHVLGPWVISQVKRTTVDGIEASKTDYNPANALPTANYSFGKRKNSLYYNADGTLKQVKDGNNNIITVSNWKRGIPQTIMYPATPDQPSGATQSAVVDDNGWISSATDENGYKTCYGYDAMGRMTSTTYPSESALNTCNTSTWLSTTQTFQKIAATEYGIPANHWKQTTSTGNARQVVYFDAFWRPLVAETYDNAAASTTRTVTVKRYDIGGRPIFQSLPVRTLTSYASIANGTSTTYDALDRVTQVSLPSTDSVTGTFKTTTQYLTGLQKKVTDPRGNQTLFTLHQAYDQPSYDLPRGINHPEGAYTEIYRDVFGSPTAIRRRNASSSLQAWRRYVYNAAHELCKTIEPENGATVMHYDGAGNLDWSASGLNLTSTTSCQDTDASIAARKTRRSYDARSRVQSLVFPDHLGDTTYAYTPDSQLASITADNGGTNQVTTQYTYNRRRLMTEERELWGSINWPINYVYNSNGHLSTKNWHGINITYVPNALGQPTQVGAYATGVSYHPNGGVARFTYGNGIVHTMTQNDRQLPERSRDVYGSSATIDDSYDYDGNGNVVAISDGLSGHRSDRTMTYDGLDRLAKTTSPMYGSTGANYSYDVLDNLTRVRVGGAAARDHFYCYDAKWRLTNIKTTNCSGATVIGLGYDDQGNLVNKNGTKFVFDFGNRLRSATTTPASAYVYDGHGRRVRDAVGSSKYSQYGNSGELLQVSDSRAGKFIEYFYLQGSLVASRERDTSVTPNVYTVKYQHTDALGSPIAVTNQARTVLERNEYEPYGKVLNHPLVDGPGYTGHVADAATGLNYMQQRYYDPGIGRFLSVDPVTAYAKPGQNFNRYWYGSNNPYKFTDPDGRVAIVNRMKDGSIQVDIPATFKGSAATETNISAVKNQVQGLSGTYKVDGKDTQVNFRITDVTKGTPRAAKNTITLTAGPTDRKNGLSAAQQGGNRAWIDVTDRFVANGTAPHEILHLADNGDRYDTATRKIDPAQGNNIMNVVPGAINSSNIQEIMQSKNNIFRNESD